MQLEHPICGFGLCLRSMTESDLGLKVAWFNDPQIRQSLIIDEILEPEKTLHWFRAVKDSPTRLDLMIEAGLSGPVGLISLVNMELKHQTAEIVLVIGKTEFWGKGVMLHAESLLIGWAFSTLKIEKIWAQTRPENIASLITMKKLGFQIEGTLRKEKLIGGRRIDIVQLGLLPKEFKPVFEQ
jgi:RimJ/RimL family protein N-acetyltransferase